MAASTCSPELTDLLAQLRTPLPVYTCFRNAAGVIRPLVKDCGCLTHEGPHWLHSDRSWREANRRLVTDHPGSVTTLTLRGFAQEEGARLNTKLHSMRALGVQQLLTAEDVLMLQSAGEPVTA